MKALVIDDALMSATLICHLLRKMGIEAISADDGQAGIELFKEQRPDVVLLDANLPGLDGYGVAKRIRQLERDGEWTPIIFLTSRSSDEDLQRGIEVGGDDFLVKPVSEVVLNAKVRAMQRIAQMRYSLVVLTRRLDEANKELTRLSSVDGLTGISNRRQFDESLAREWARSLRSAAPLSLLMCDVDYFKQYNDLYGHQAGDECLIAVARVLQSRVKRPADVAARYGGEEFAIVLPDTDKDGAISVAETVREGIAELKMRHEGAKIGMLSISIGVASVIATREGSAAEMLLAAADAALYAAKQKGRNRVESAPGGSA
ncbi:MAG: diguanylate cyclase [Uliginosibacterium sp.]|jgi:diguanylate cyclase (GGDEF)-like protein|nr:diguanylate cyclase [Uliginosibacterium sp.]MBK9393332.1 diguanylate cyclase [Uliginosibacterium sp.]MBK9616292.1 diguanylate cyclase [Uliginosibacterium sp.]